MPSLLPKLLLIVLMVFLLPVGIASAHTLKTDGSIGVTMHIDPDDDPIVGQPANFYLEFADKQNKFQPNLCNCVITITEGGQQIFSQTLAKTIATGSMTGNGDFTFTFPKKDVYQVTLSGQPMTPNAFQSFTVKFDIRVDRSAATSSTSSMTPNSSMQAMSSTSSNSSDNPLYILAGAAGAVVLLGLVGVMGLKLKTHKPSQLPPASQPQSPQPQTPTAQSTSNNIPPTNSNNPS